MADVAGAILKGYDRWERKPADFYATPHETTQSIIDALGLPKDWFILDPGCGDGKLLRVFTANGYDTTLGTDLRHTGYGAGGVDFLTAKFVGPQPDAIVMNPPFSLATEFIERALEMRPKVIAVLLKADFWNAQDRLSLGRTARFTHEYPLTWRPAFLEKERGKSPLMNCTWFVWRRDASGFFWRQLERPTAVPKIEGLGLTVAMANLAAALDDLSETLAG